MRLGLSHLRQQLHSYHIIDSPYCLGSNCHRQPESTEHYFLHCLLYAASRNEMIRGLGLTVARLGINTNSQLVKLMLNGHKELSISENITLQNFVQIFINSTGRFWNYLLTVIAIYEHIYYITWMCIVIYCILCIMTKLLYEYVQILIMHMR